MPESLKTAIHTALTEAQTGLANLLADGETLAALEHAGRMMAETFQNGGRVFSCGNGGSMCDAMHFAEELSGRYRLDRPALAAASISDVSHMSCVGNDYGYDFVFSRYLEAHARPGDVLVAISTSGKSKNIINAAQAAKAKGARVIAMTGKRDCPLAADSDILLATPAGRYADRVQELHIKLIHIMIEMVERQLFPALYA
ncbi:MAG: SIS domain-containing protein [Alphaproteobacteria bacterium]|nr:SIS domain-containing protein [Alphaproteobacteria bacterium]